MKKNLSVAAAAVLLAAVGTAWAIGSAPVRTGVIAPADEWTASPENGSSTSELPNTADRPYQTITFTTDALDEDNFDKVVKDKVTVTYAGKTLEQVLFPRDEEPGEDSNGYNAFPAEDYNGVQVIVNYQVFTEPGDLVITLEEGAVVNYDGNKSPRMEYTRSYGKEQEKCLEVKKLSPENGATVKSLSKVYVYFDLTTLGEEFVNCDNNLAAQITLTSSGSVVNATGAEYAEDAPYEEEAMAFAVTFPEVTAAGDYTLNIPTGFFWTTSDTGSKPIGALESKAITASYKVDPTLKAPIDNYEVLSPLTSPDEIPSLSEVLIKFPEMQMLQFDEEAVATLTKDGQPTDYLCQLGYDWSEGTANIAKVYFIDKDYEDAVITEYGEYVLTIPAGAIQSLSGESNSGFELSFKVNPDAKPVFKWSADPANGSQIEMPSENAKYIDITFMIDNASEIDIKNEWTDPEGGFVGKSKTITVTYDDKNLRMVENAAGDALENEGYQVRNGWEDNEFSIRINRALFTRAGKLEISIDEGKFTVDELYPSPSINYSLTVGDISAPVDYKVVIEPASDPGKEYDFSYFKEFTVKFTNAKTAKPRTRKDYDDDDKPIVVDDVNPDLKIGTLVYYGDYTVTEVKDAEFPTFVISFPDIEEFNNELGGALVFSLEKGAFLLDGDNDSPAVSQSWQLIRTKEIDTSYVCGPLGDIVNEGYGLFPAFVFSIEEDITTTGECTVSLNGNVIEGIKPKVQNWAVSFELTSAIFKDPQLTGSITITIPAGAVKVSGKPLEEIKHTWGIVLPKTFDYNFNPGLVDKQSGEEPPVVTDLSEITLDIPEAQSVMVYNNNYINLRSQDYFTYGAKAPISTEITTQNGNPAVKMTFSPAPDKDALYELSFDYGALYIDHAYSNPSMTYLADFQHTTGVNIIAPDADGLYTVSSIDGKVIVNKGTADKVRTLDKGIYIVNGKKLHIR